MFWVHEFRTLYIDDHKHTWTNIKVKYVSKCEGSFHVSYYSGR